jgi:hypothetical protein
MTSRAIAIVTRLSPVLLLIFLTSSVACSKAKESGLPSTGVPATSVSSTGTRTTPPPTSKPASSTSVSAGNVLRLKTVSYIDQQGIGTEAFKLLIPSDWQSEGGIQWLLDNPGMPAVSQLRVWNPKGAEQFQVFPNQAFFWTDNPMTMALFPVGSKYFGNEVKAPLKPVQALREIVIPRFRNVQGLKVVSEQDISNLISPSGPGGGGSLKTTTEAGKIRIEYTENGKTMEDEIYCVVEATYFPIQSMSGTTNNILWGVNYIASFRAEKGKLDAGAKLFQTISKSVTLNLEWFNKYVQVVEYLIKMNIQKIISVGQLGSIIAQTGSEIRQENLDLYNQREAMNDRVSNQFSQYMRDVEPYYDPVAQKNIELPTGYDNAWVDNSGQYVLSDNPNFNPNVGGNQSFQRLETAKK